MNEKLKAQNAKNILKAKILIFVLKKIYSHWYKSNFKWLNHIVHVHCIKSSKELHVVTTQIHGT